MRINKTIFIAITTIIIRVGCAYKTPYTNRSQMIFMSQKEEMALGEKSYKESLYQSKIITGTKDATRIKNIVEEAEIARGSFYQYFESKEDLLKYILNSKAKNLEAFLKQSLQETKR